LSISSRGIAATAIGLTGAFFVVLAFDPLRTLWNLGHLFAVPDARMVTLRILAGVGGLITIGFSWAKPPTRAITAAALLTAALLAFMNLKILPAVDRQISARTIARDCFRFNPSCKNVSFFGLSRESRYGLDYYFGRKVPEWTPGTPPPEWLLTTSGIARGLIGDRFNQVSSSGEPFVVLLKNTPPADLSK
jgi:hypothetical protein